MEIFMKKFVSVIMALILILSLGSISVTALNEEVSTDSSYWILQVGIFYHDNYFFIPKEVLRDLNEKQEATLKLPSCENDKSVDCFVLFNSEISYPGMSEWGYGACSGYIGIDKHFRDSTLDEHYRLTFEYSEDVSFDDFDHFGYVDTGFCNYFVYCVDGSKVLSLTNEELNTLNNEHVVYLEDKSIKEGTYITDIKYNANAQYSMAASWTAEIPKGGYADFEFWTSTTGTISSNQPADYIIHINYDEDNYRSDFYKFIRDVFPFFLVILKLLSDFLGMKL